MSNQKPAPASAPSIPEALPNIPLDENVWKAWLKKNEEKDRASAAKWVLVLKVFAVVLPVGAVIWFFV